MTPLELLQYLAAAGAGVLMLALALSIVVTAVSRWRDDQLRRSMGVLHPDTVKKIAQSGAVPPVVEVPIGTPPPPVVAESAPLPKRMRDRKIYGGPES